MKVNLFPKAKDMKIILFWNKIQNKKKNFNTLNLQIILVFMIRLYVVPFIKKTNRINNININKINMIKQTKQIKQIKQINNIYKIINNNNIYKINNKNKTQLN